MEWLKEFYQGDIEYNVNLKNFTTYKIGGLGAAMVSPSKEEEVIELLEAFKNRQTPYVVLGQGSNVLFGDEYFPGVVVNLSKCYNTFRTKGNKLEVDSGCRLSKLASYSKKSGYLDFFALSGIPGTVGGALITNAEAHKVSIGDFIVQVKAWTPEGIKILTQNECDFTYRKSIFTREPNWIILSCQMQFKQGSAKELQIMELKQKEYKEYRREKQPHLPSAGSVFKNPTGVAAGKLIDELGMKGLKIGGAIISKEHANFILNEKEATAEDVLSLIRMIKVAVKEEFNLELDLEIKLINCEV